MQRQPNAHDVALEQFFERSSYHKQEIAKHRRALRDIKKKEAEFIASCRELGIKLTSAGNNHG